jgi:N-formylglutamate deformylase
MMNAQVPIFNFLRGNVPLLVSMPHSGTRLPQHLADRMSAAALTLPDTDWHLETLYNFLGELGASVLFATHSRYLIDLNRPPDNANLYPGQNTTGLCPMDTFDGQPVYQPGKEPNEAEIAQRRLQFWEPYHGALVDELRRIRDLHGIAMLWDAHSIGSMIPRFFAGRLPDFNIGTASGTSCAEELSGQLAAIASTASGYSHALNGRFKGGYITRQYGDPDNNIHAVQLELSQITYMEERFPYRFHEEAAREVRLILRRFLEKMLSWANTHDLHR